MKSSFFSHENSKVSSSVHSSPSHTLHDSSHRPTFSFSESTIDSNVAAAESIITKWDPESSSYAKITSLFYESRREAKDFLRSVSELQQAMDFYMDKDSSSQKLVRAHTLMQIAMKRLQKEFYQILAANRDHLDPESVSTRSSTTTRSRSSVSDIEDDVGPEDEIQIDRNSIQEVEGQAWIATVDLQSISECMISSGYGKECVNIYKIIRKSIVEEGIYRLGFDRFCLNRVQKMDWEVLEPKINNWLSTAKVAVRTLFYGERVLSDHVFTASNITKESCFAEIATESAIHLFSFPEKVARSKKSPDKIFRFLDLYNTICDLWPDMESIFSYESTSTIQMQAVKSLIKLADGIRAMLKDFESSIQKDSSRSPVSGGGIHPLTTYVMNYLCLLGDYTETLTDILADYPLQMKNTLLENSPLSSFSAHVEWWVLVLLCKLDKKAELYKDSSLSYLFLANNLQYVVSKVRSCDLRYLLCNDWILKHESKIQQYTANYKRIAWSKVMSTLKAEMLGEFNSAFETACRIQSGWVVPDVMLRDEIKKSVNEEIVPAYRVLYDKYRVSSGDENTNAATFAPEDLERLLLSDLFRPCLET